MNVDEVNGFFLLCPQNSLDVALSSLSTVQRTKWCSILQEWVKEQMVFCRPRFGPGSHCQKNGFLELKGIKSKIYAAIITEQIWLYKNEQVISSSSHFQNSCVVLICFLPELLNSCSKAVEKGLLCQSRRNLQ